MRLCLMIEGQEGVSWDDWVRLARLTERHGLDGLFRSDHYTSFPGTDDRRTTDCWATLAGLARETSRIRLGSLVSPVTFRVPGAFAKTVATVDEMSGGRIEAGLGAEVEHDLEELAGARVDLQRVEGAAEGGGV